MTTQTLTIHRIGGPPAAVPSASAAPTWQLRRRTCTARPHPHSHPHPHTPPPPPPPPPPPNVRRFPSPQSAAHAVPRCPAASGSAATAVAAAAGGRGGGGGGPRLSAARLIKQQTRPPQRLPSPLSRPASELAPFVGCHPLSEGTAATAARAQGAGRAGGDGAIATRDGRAWGRVGGWKPMWVRRRGDVVARGYRWSDEEDVAVTGVANVREKWNEAVELFNTGQYYTCHDVLEELWQQAQEPQRSVIHGLLQCAVGMHHLLAQNHQGAMMEFGEGLNKLRRYTSSSATLRYSRPALPEISSSSSSSSSPSSSVAAQTGGAGGSSNSNSSSVGSMCWVEAFEREATAVLEFIYSTQLEHAACSQEVCVTMDGSDESYARLGNYGRGQQLYRLSLAHAISNESQSKEQQQQQQQQVPGDAGDGERWQLEFCPPRDFVAAVTGELPPSPPLLAVVVPRLDPSHADLDNLVW